MYIFVMYFLIRLNRVIVDYKFYYKVVYDYVVKVLFEESLNYF